MKGRTRFVGMVLLLAVLVAACAEPESNQVRGVARGSLARDFTLETLEGQEVSLSDFEGQVVLVNFWAAWCPPCRAEIPDLETAYREHGEEGFIVLGVNIQDPPQAVEPFVRDMDMTYPVLLDEAGKVMKEYRATGLPMSVLIDRDGVIQVRHIGHLSADQLADYLADLLP